MAILLVASQTTELLAVVICEKICGCACAFVCVCTVECIKMCVCGCMNIRMCLYIRFSIRENGGRLALFIQICFLFLFSKSQDK